MTAFPSRVMRTTSNVGSRESIAATGTASRAWPAAGGAAATTSGAPPAAAAGAACAARCGSAPSASGAGVGGGCAAAAAGGAAATTSGAPPAAAAGAACAARCGSAPSASGAGVGGGCAAAAAGGAAATTSGAPPAAAAGAACAARCGSAPSASGAGVGGGCAAAAAGGAAATTSGAPPAAAAGAACAARCGSAPSASGAGVGGGCAAAAAGGAAGQRCRHRLLRSRRRRACAARCAARPRLRPARSNNARVGGDVARLRRSRRVHYITRGSGVWPAVRHRLNQSQPAPLARPVVARPRLRPALGLAAVARLRQPNRCSGHHQRCATGCRSRRRLRGPLWLGPVCVRRWGWRRLRGCGDRRPVRGVLGCGCRGLRLALRSGLARRIIQGASAGRRDDALPPIACLRGRRIRRRIVCVRDFARWRRVRSVVWLLRGLGEDGNRAANQCGDGGEHDQITQGLITSFGGGREREAATISPGARGTNREPSTA